MNELPQNISFSFLFFKHADKTIFILYLIVLFPTMPKKDAQNSDFDKWKV